jgi:hypothetical protein
MVTRSRKFGKRHESAGEKGLYAENCNRGCYLCYFLSFALAGI